MNTARKKYRNSIIFILSCLVILFMPGVGDVRWAGLIGFIYIGIPWYILALKDLVIDKIENGGVAKKKIRFYSMSLFIFGALSMVIGVAIDLFILKELISNPSTGNFLTGVARLLIGIPFFGFGIYLIHISFGKVKKECD